MADMSKAEKLAAARRKLKEFQQKTKESSPHPVKDAIQKDVVKPPDFGVKSTLEENSVFDSGPAPVNHVSKELTEITEYTTPENHVTLTEENLVPCSSPVNVFQNPGTTENSITNNVNIYGSESTVMDSKSLEVELDSKPLFSEDSRNYNFFEQYAPSKLDVPPNNPLSNMFAANNFFDNVSNFTSTSVAQHPYTDTLSEVGMEMLPSPAQLFQTDETQQIALPENAHAVAYDSNAENHDRRTGMQVPPTETQSDSNDSTEQNEIGIKPDSLFATEAVVNHSRSSTESLRQLSHQISDLINESHEVTPLMGENHELENRNQELAAMLSAEKQKNEQLRQQLREHQSRTSQLQREIDELRTDCDARLSREVGSLQEQLQLHVQTVGLLVGEKTELQAALSKSQQTAKQKAADNEEMQGRLKSLRLQVSEFEKEVAVLKENSKQQEKMNSDLLLEVDRLKMEQKLLKKQVEDTDEEASELRQRLQSKTNECASLREECQGKQSQLALTQLRVQQLSMPDSTEMSSQLESLHQQNVSLERQLAELQQVARTSTAERDQSSQQYQQYVQQLNSQLHSIAAKLESVTAENEQLTAREQNMVRHISELEKQLQQQQQQKQLAQIKQEPQSANAVRELEERLSAVEGEKVELAKLLETQTQEVLLLKEELEVRNLKLDEANLWVEKLQSNQPDQEKLLAAMESDKVAAARAVGQNQQLKQQLEELQEGFVRMSNNKLELTEKLQYEQHISKELGERLAQQESELKDLRTLLEKKDEQIKSLEQNSQELSTQVLQHHQIADRMRHYEAQGHFSDLLQQELAQAKEHIEKLSKQNSELNVLLAQNNAKSDDNISSPPDERSQRKDEMLATLSASVTQLELERNQLIEQLKEQSKTSSDEIPSVSSSETLKNEYKTMREAMEKLEERFASKMRDVAELSDEKQRLEHLVLQLQGETETIGEYIALYQVQRSILRERAKEKDEQLSKLARDREELKTKLNSLNNLVQDLLTKKEQRMSSDIPSVHLPGIPNGVVSDDDVPETDTPKSATSTTVHKDSPPVEKETAQKILDLLTEIKTSNLVEPHNSENFHPCPWCSGQLIDV